jgi:hypothetical protein
MSDMKRLFYVWFLGAKECRGLRGDEFVRPIVRYVHFLSSFLFKRVCYSNFGASNYRVTFSTHHSPCKGLITSCFVFFFFLIRLVSLSLFLPSFRSRRNNNKTNDQSPFSLLFSRLREARGTVFIFFQGEGKEGILKLKTSASYSSLSPLLMARLNDSFVPERHHQSAVFFFPL